MSADKFSAYATIVQKFQALCSESSISPREAWVAIGRLGGYFEGGEPSLSGGLSSASSQSVERQQPSADDVKKAKVIARKEKAKKLGISEKEVNLTSAEVKEAIRRLYQQSASKPPNISGGTSSLPQAERVSDLKPKESVKAMPPSAKEVGGSGDRQTVKTRIDNFRRSALRAAPAAIADPTNLHLVAYSNSYRRLAGQWEFFKTKYGSEGLKDPLRGLPDPWFLAISRDLLVSVTANLRQQSDSPGTFILQDAEGGSFWDRDMPHQVRCPELLKKPLSREVYDALEGAAHKSK